MYFLFFFVFFAEEEARRIVYSSNDMVTVTTRSGERVKHLLIPIGSTEGFFFGLERTDDLIAARKGKDPIDFQPTVRGIPFSDIVRLDYGQSKVRAPYVGP